MSTAIQLTSPKLKLPDQDASEVKLKPLNPPNQSLVNIFQNLYLYEIYKLMEVL